MKPGEVVQGHIPAVDVDLNEWVAEKPKLIPWTEAAYLGEGSIAKGEQKKNPKVWNDVPIPQHVFEKWDETSPKPIRRSARERYESLVLRLTETARITTTVYGYPRWPDSVQKVLDSLGVKPTASQRDQITALAKHYIVKAENQQRRKDEKKVVLDYHGHYD